MLSALQLLKNQMKSAHELFESTFAGVTAENLQIQPGGTALPLSATYAHLVLSEDVIVHGMLQGKPSLAETSWKDKTGIDKPMPSMMDPEWSKQNTEWAKTVQLDLDQVKEYVKAVYSATDEYLNSLQDTDLEKESDMGAMGKKVIVEVISDYLIGHTNSLAGEISVLKGLQGLKGYPF